MGDKPYLQIEVDEHFSNVGVITRIEAFLNSLQHRPAVALPTDFNIEQVDIHPCRLAQTPSPNVPLYLPAMGAYTPYLAAYFKQQGADPYELPHLTDDILSLGRAETSAKEYLPFPALLGSILAERKNDQTHAQFLIPQTQGAEADGQYARVIRAVLDRRKEQNAQLISPMLETLPEMAQNRDALFRALLAGDILYAAPVDQRADMAAQWDALPDWKQLHTAAREIGTLPAKGRRIAAVGTPLCLTELDSGVLAALEAEANRCFAPHSARHSGFCGKTIWMKTNHRLVGLTRCRGRCRPLVMNLERTVPLRKTLKHCSSLRTLPCRIFQAGTVDIGTPRPWSFLTVPMQC